MKTYTATARGFANGKVIEAGEQFDYAGKPGAWMELVDTKAPKKGKAEPAEKAAPETSGTANADVI